jgi:hypothetical protein
MDVDVTSNRESNTTIMDGSANSDRSSLGDDDDVDAAAAIVVVDRIQSSTAIFAPRT